MLGHYLTMAVRSFARHKLYSLINTVGLALGLACVIFIVLFVRYETSYDRWIPDSSSLYRIELTLNLPGLKPAKTALTPFPIADAMREGIPGVTAATRLRPRGATLWVGNRSFVESVDVADSNFFQVIRLPLLEGNPGRVLAQPESLVLAQDTARKFFGNANPMGRMVSVRWTQCARADADCKPQSVALMVTGIMRNVPSNSQLTATVVAPNTSIFRWSPQEEQTWLTASWYSYVKLAPGVDPRAVLARLRLIMDQAMAPGLAKRSLKGPGSSVFGPHLTAFRDVHLDSSGYWQNMTPAGSRITVYGTAVIGLLILLVACFNFMNLTTARATLRAREISLRKCVGASRRQLIAQLLAESVVLALCSLTLALVLVEVLLPVFDGFLERPIAFHYLADWPISLMVLGIAVGAGLLSGSYPALILSGFRPGSLLRTGGSGQLGSGRLRSALVVLQFAVSIGLGIAAIVAARQISFARGIDVGFDPYNVVVMTTPYPHTQSFIEAVRKQAGVLGTALSDSDGVPFAQEYAHGHPLGLVRVPGRPGTTLMSMMKVGPNFPPLYRIPLLAGRLVSDTRSEDTLTDSFSPQYAGHSILINAAAAARLGYTPRQAIGKTIIFDLNPVRIVGVLANIKDSGALDPVKPMVFLNDRFNMQTISIRLSGHDTAATLAFIDRTWRTFAPLSTPQHYFLSARYGLLYRSYQKQGVMLEIFVGVAIIIAVLGLFGLTVFTAERRTKEIGIRKVSGARTHDIVRLMLWRISVPVLLANLIAWPAAYYFLRGWLDGYAYRISLDPAYFLAGGAVALAIAWVTVLAHTLHLARTTAAHALRYE
jgi:putative ABC transport system permease protein